MIKRTPQEIADFFGCYVAMDKSGRWYVYRNKPERREKDSFWFEPLSFSLYLNDSLIDIPASHDWTTLYEPAIKEKVKKLVPFDLSKKKDRDALRGKWIVDSGGGEHFINAFYPTREVCNGVYLTMRTICGNAIILFENYTFLDGSPVGKEVEE